MILNLTQHAATPEQLDAGVVNVSEDDKAKLTALLTFDTLPSRQDVAFRASDIAALAVSYHADCCMIGGAPFLMTALEIALQAHSIKPVYAFSQRVSIDAPQADGSVKKVAVFKHCGFVDA